MNKYNFKDTSMFNKPSNLLSEDSTFTYGIVVSVDDEFDTGVIKVRLGTLDSHLNNNDDLVTCFPLLPKFFFVKPKVNETVLIFTPDKKNAYIDRMYLGPLISQPQFLKMSELDTAKSGLDSGIKLPTVAPSKIPEAKGVYGRGEDLTIQGRENTDIQFKPSEILLRAGKENNAVKIKGVPTFNTKDQSYIQIKSSYSVGNGNKIGVINLVANKINLLSHDNDSSNFKLYDQDKMISDEEMVKILNTAHPLPFGDLLIDLLSIMRRAIIEHVHCYPGDPAQDLIGTDDLKKLENYDIQSILSKNIKIN